jgi:hypothetical protein
MKKITFIFILFASCCFAEDIIPPNEIEESKQKTFFEKASGYFSSNFFVPIRG